MRGVILCGGYGTRLRPLTEVTNKHLVKVGRLPMVAYPIKSLIKAGVDEIMIVTGGESVGDFLKFIGDGSRFGAKIVYYSYQSSDVLGIPAAMFLAREFVKDQKFICILGDNFLEDSLAPHIKKFEAGDKGAHILLKEVPDPERFGIAEVRGDKVVRCVEKPKEPKSNLAITGIYFFDKKVWNLIPRLKPSTRNELEIVDLLTWYAENDDLGFDIIKGKYLDMGTHEAIEETEEFLREKGGG